MATSAILLQSALSPTPLPPDARKMLVGRIESGSLDLPLLPEVTREVIALTSDESCDPRRLATLIRRDQAMATHLLRVANSPLYLAPVPIVTVQQGISRLGLVTIRQIAILITCQTRTFQVSGYEREVQVLFQHSLGAALFAQEIARARRMNVEEAFLCGLLHDVGRPMLLQALLDIQRKLEITIEPPAMATAIDEFHARVGSELAARWSLSPRLSETILNHHQPERAQAHGAGLVTLADDLAHLLCGPKSITEEQCRKHPVLPMLNLYPDEMDALLQRRGAIAEAMRALS